MRPLLWDLDVSLTPVGPARMTICFPDRPNRYITVRIRAAVTTLDEAKLAAVRELNGFTPEQLLLLAESSRPVPVWPDPAAATVMSEKVEREERYPGPLFCPACCRKLGRGDSPAIGYLEACPSCGRRIRVTFAPGAVTIILWPEP